MPLTSFQPILSEARKHHFAAGAFNVINMETMQAVVSAGEKSGVPVIAQVYHSHLDFAGADFIGTIGRTAAERSSQPVCISLDHGRSYGQAKECIECGFTGVMIDLSADDYGKNVETTKRVVELAHARGVSVEAELGKIFGADSTGELIRSGMTDPELAARFAEDTGVDALAVSVGTAHGFYAERPQIDFPRLERILQLVKCPVVVHGGSNTPDEDILEIVRLGVAKINIGTDLMAAFEAGMREALRRGAFVDIQEALELARAKVEEVCADKIRLLTAFQE